jgi:hypothetical protein
VPFGTTSQISAPPPPSRETGSRTLEEKHTCSWPTSVISDSVGTAGPAFSLCTMQISRFRRRLCPRPPNSSRTRACIAMCLQNHKKRDFRARGGIGLLVGVVSVATLSMGYEGRLRGAKGRVVRPRVHESLIRHAMGCTFIESMHKGVWGSRPSPNPPLRGRPS